MAGPRIMPWLAAILLLALPVGAGLAADPPVHEFLAQVQSAARALDYEGIYVYQQGALLESSRLVHVVDGTGERERLQALDGEPHECLRENGTERCLMPRLKVIVEQPARSDHFPGLLLGQAPAIAEHYDWLPELGQFRIAGRDCVVSQLLARDDLRYGYRFCTDSENKLLLKAQTLAADGSVVDQTAFSHILFGADVAPKALDSPWKTEGWEVQKQAGEPVNLRERGWRFTLPRGFVPVVELSRPIGRAHGVDQMVISDGLAAISIFIETFDPERDQSIRQGGMLQGAMNIYRKRLASFWLTAVGEVPAQTVHDLVQSAEFVPQPAH